MNKLSKAFLYTASVSALVACGGAKVDDSFFQADNISASAGNVCIEGATISPNGNEAKETVSRLKQFYGGTESGETPVHVGVFATCTSYKDKPKANTIITKAYYEDTVIPKTKW